MSEGHKKLETNISLMAIFIIIAISLGGLVEIAGVTKGNCSILILMPPFLTTTSSASGGRVNLKSRPNTPFKWSHRSIFRLQKCLMVLA